MLSLLDQELATERFTSDQSGIRSGRVTDILPSGEVFVDYPGNNSDPVRAHLLNTRVGGLEIDDRVLLSIEPEVSRRPIVLGALVSRLPQREQGDQLDVVATDPASPDAVIDGKTITLSGRDEVVLRCGKSSITLKKDGKILIKGAHLISRASCTNKIKGGSVAIN